MPRNKKSSYNKHIQKDKLYIVDKDTQLLIFLLEIWPEKSRNEIKSYLAHRQISVNDKTETSFNFNLNIGDKLVWKSIGEKRENPNHKVKILYEDDDMIVVDKKPGVLTMSTGKENEQTAYSVMMEHVRRYGKNNRVFIVHRLDRDTSGLLLFAKSEIMQELLQSNWNKETITRKYVAVIEGVPKEKSGKIISWLTENQKSLKMSASPVDNGGKKAITNYKVINSNNKYSLLEIDLETGRKNQIRVQLASIGHPIAGDKRYGANSNPLGRLCLHAQLISFTHPINHKKMIFDTGIPSIFR